MEGACIDRGVDGHEGSWAMNIRGQLYVYTKTGDRKGLEVCVYGSGYCYMYSTIAVYAFSKKAAKIQTLVYHACLPLYTRPALP